ncbi:uncharacterized protein TRAVEDRAFT_54379 [Trametes versicolor FP-101664 SS1]|uniref:Uncharacterized protein n=1 Tax=Trametes versicolor (strain FP-101664) TaxID=717944 RepID=R7S7K9_TRAVS|nr:uncharacterized protein TRAVEDRAFT_54379 [Trametes versicolor FP-101664 SS1]EIW51625.1 hypothetical protein TRAVEDRAFT_54379 [Trametes versicolor FP-101664 SS1]
MTSVVGTQPSVTDTSSATPTSVGSDPNFTFGTMPYTMDTCGSTTVGWDYIGADCNITLLISTVVTNLGDVSSPILDLVIGQDVDAASESFLWSSVNLTAGIYVLWAMGPNIAAESTIFTIVNGTNTSCLSGVPAHSPASTAKPVPDGNGTNGTTTQTSSILSEKTAVPQPSPSTTRHSQARSGIIAGGIVGGLGVLAAAIVAFVYLRRRRAHTHGTVGEQEREKVPGALVQDDSEKHSSPLGHQRSITPLSEPPRLEPNRGQPFVALRPAALQSPEVQIISDVKGGTLRREPSITSPTPPTSSNLHPAVDPNGDAQSVSTRTYSYKTSDSDSSGVGLLDSLVPSSATSQMYRGWDSDVGSARGRWSSLHGDRYSRYLDGSVSAYSLEDLATLPPLEVADRATFPDGC